MKRATTGRTWRRLLLTAALGLSSPTLLATSDRDGRFEERVLAAHNRERAEVGVPSLRWNPALAADAARWGARLAREGRLYHYQEAPNDPDPEGENLWAGTSGHYTLEQMVGLWSAEKQAYRPGLFPTNSRTGRLEDVAHYTQIVWRSTGEVGCAIARGARDEMLVCRYAEGGNVIGERPF